MHAPHKADALGRARVRSAQLGGEQKREEGEHGAGAAVLVRGGDYLGTQVRNPVGFPPPQLRRTKTDPSTE